MAKRKINKDENGVFIRLNNKIYRPGRPDQTWPLFFKQYGNVMEMLFVPSYLERLELDNDAKLPITPADSYAKEGDMVKTKENEMWWGWLWITGDNYSEIWFQSF